MNRYDEHGRRFAHGYKETWPTSSYVSTEAVRSDYLLAHKQGDAEGAALQAKELRARGAAVPRLHKNPARPAPANAVFFATTKGDGHQIIVTPYDAESYDFGVYSGGDKWWSGLLDADAVRKSIALELPNQKYTVKIDKLAKNNPSAFTLTLKDQHGRTVQLPWRTVKDGRPGNESIALRASFHTDPNDATREWVSGSITRDGKVVATWPRPMRAGKTVANPRGRDLYLTPSGGPLPASDLAFIKKCAQAMRPNARPKDTGWEAIAARPTQAAVLIAHKPNVEHALFAYAAHNGGAHARFGRVPEGFRHKNPAKRNPASYVASQLVARAGWVHSDFGTGAKRWVVSLSAPFKHDKRLNWGVEGQGTTDDQAIQRLRADAMNHGYDLPPAALLLVRRAVMHAVTSDKGHGEVRAGAATKRNPAPFYGAPMGYGSRPEAPDTAATRLVVRRGKLDGLTVYVVKNADTGEVVEPALRASAFLEAKEKVRRKYPNAKVKGGFPTKPRSNPAPFYGAPMGYGSRSEAPDTTTTLLVRRVKLDSGGYASDGAYFGIGRPVYVVTNADTGSVVESLRAADFVDAKEKMRSKYPNAKVK